jgi:ubiquinone/menaquinone biosynthesis C-methylase UbiE
MKLDPIESETRQLFHQLHSAQLKNDQIFARLVDLLNPSYLEEPEDFFHGKTCLDAGCGSNANATLSMLIHGAEMVKAFDLDESIMETAPTKLTDFEGKYELTTGSVLEIPFPDQSFDFVHCSGVLHHSTDVMAGLKELVRVARPGAPIYIMTYGKGGIVRDITTLLRKRYAEDPGFRALVDDLEPEWFLELFAELKSSMFSHGDPSLDNVTDEQVSRFFDQDLVLTIKDRIAAPLYLEHSEEELTKAFNSFGCSKVTRLTRYPKLSNLRRILSPLYEQYDNPFAKLFYGDGAPQLKAIRD